jgi:hypothetical protein
MMAWSIVATHRRQVRDGFNRLGVVQPPHHAMFAELDIGCTRLYDESSTTAHA